MEGLCPFCRKFLAHGDLRWYDQEIYRDENFVVVPGLGPFVEGYVMLLTRQHYRSFSVVPEALWNSLLDLRSSARSLVEASFGESMLFEHGPGPLTSGGSCIDHAHWHIMPSIPGFATELRSRHDFRPINIRDIHRFADSSYLLLENSEEQAYAAVVESLPGQYMRRIAAELVGCANEWDYAVFPRLDIVRVTLDKLQVEE
jgi:diadenosine tetraphosphate (Ap4A) HIT family hydrolase